MYTDQPSFISEFTRTFTHLFQGYVGPSVVLWMPASVQGTLTSRRPTCITASAHCFYSIQFLQNVLSETYCPSAGAFPRAFTARKHFHSQRAGAVTFSDTALFWPCALLYTYRFIARPYPVLQLPQCKLKISAWHPLTWSVYTGVTEEI